MIRDAKKDYLKYLSSDYKNDIRKYLHTYIHICTQFYNDIALFLQNTDIKMCLSDLALNNVRVCFQ